MFRKKNNYRKISGAYISELDKYLTNFDQNHTWLAMQLAEFTKHKRIFYLRDNSLSIVKEKALWDFE